MTSLFWKDQPVGRVRARVCARGLWRRGSGGEKDRKWIEPGQEGGRRGYKLACREREAEPVSSASSSIRPDRSSPPSSSHPLSYPVSLSLSRTRIMEIPIQYPWYRRALSPRVSDVASTDLFLDWPLIWPFSWSLPWTRSFLRWFNWPENGHTEVNPNSPVSLQWPGALI